MHASISPRVPEQQSEVPPMPRPQTPSKVTRELYALVVYLHASANRDLLTAIAREELTFTQLALLDRLRGGRAKPTVRQAASMLDVSQPAASRLVHQLAVRGLVQREADERDTRVKRIAITDRGEAVIVRLHACRIEHVERFTHGLTVAQRQQLEQALADVTAREEIAAYRPAAA